jgi:hypothetical protein
MRVRPVASWLTPPVMVIVPNDPCQLTDSPCTTIGLNFFGPESRAVAAAQPVRSQVRRHQKKPHVQEFSTKGLQAHGRGAARFTCLLPLTPGNRRPHVHGTRILFSVRRPLCLRSRLWTGDLYLAFPWNSGAGRI